MSRLAMRVELISYDQQDTGLYHMMDSYSGGVRSIVSLKQNVKYSHTLKILGKAAKTSMWISIVRSAYRLYNPLF